MNRHYLQEECYPKQRTKTVEIKEDLSGHIKKSAVTDPWEQIMGIYI